VFTDADKRACALRELKMRRRVYKRWVAEGRMSEAEAEREIALMQAIADDYADPNLFSRSGVDA
jgi:hypothetical protein